MLNYKQRQTYSGENKGTDIVHLDKDKMYDWNDNGEVCMVCGLTGIKIHYFLDCPDKCKICNGIHLTKEHSCMICHLIGIESHESSKCPYRCKICDGIHLTKEHWCMVCGLIGINSHEWGKCPDRCEVCNGIHKKDKH